MNSSLCTKCSRLFNFTAEDERLYEVLTPRIGGESFPFPQPKTCPDCRVQQRLSWRNERALYRRKCDFSGDDIISVYAPDAPAKVFSTEVWWSDEFDPFGYGREIDFSRPFFEQFRELDRTVPKLALYNTKSQNSAYTNYASENKDCYLVVSALANETCFHSYRIFYSKDVIDCEYVRKCELCYDCSSCVQCFECESCSKCRESSRLLLCYDCIGCHDCVACVNLRNQQYSILNQRYSAAEYTRRRDELLQDPHALRTAFSELRAHEPHRAVDVIQCENCSGDQLRNCKNCSEVYLLTTSEDCRYVYTGESNKSCYDISFIDNSELCFNCGSVEQAYQVYCSQIAWYVHDCYYSHLCLNGHHLFGCSGIKRGEYCILNQPYTPAEFEVMTKRLVRHMRETGEWGEFFPMNQSPYPYNESVAQDHYPLSQREAVALGCHWREPNRSEFRAQTYVGSHDIRTVHDSVCQELFVCSACGRNYRIVLQELMLYRKLGVNLPEKCPDCRHRARVGARPARVLSSRKCAECGNEILSTFDSKSRERVVCEDCYQRMVVGIG